MKPAYRTFFALKREPFAQELAIEDIMKTPALISVKDRFDYAVRLGAMALVTGEGEAANPPP